MRIADKHRPDQSLFQHQAPFRKALRVRQGQRTSEGVQGEGFFSRQPLPQPKMHKSTSGFRWREIAELLPYASSCLFR